MTFYRYKAFDEGGVIHKGIIEASSLETLRDSLCAQNLSLVSHSRDLSSFFKRKPRTKVLMDICLHLEQFENAGIPLIESLEELQNTQSSQKLKSILEEVKTNVKGGDLLSQAFSNHPQFFDAVFIGMIAAGEKTGNLTLSYQQLSQYLKWLDEIQAQTLKAFRYPLIIIAVFIAMLFILLVVLLPEIAKFMEMSSTPLPWSIKILLTFSHLITNHGFFLSLLLLSLSFSLAVFLHIHPKGSRWKSYFLDHIPVLGHLRKTLDLTRFSHIFALVYSSGINILHALETTRNTIKTGHLHEAIKLLETDIREGLSLSIALQKTSLFPSFMIRMIQIGEKTSSLETSLLYIKDSFDTALKRRVDHFIGLIEPSMFVFVGLILAWTVSSIFLPLYETLSTLDN
ncbi:MAG: type II secretion system F family protein [Alphaproteobacteria bacterium]|nr:type II secretion system F family protein [Alphaproteobacteria bacterium]